MSPRLGWFVTKQWVTARNYDVKLHSSEEKMIQNIKGIPETHNVRGNFATN